MELKADKQKFEEYALGIDRILTKKEDNINTENLTIGSIIKVNETLWDKPTGRYLNLIVRQIRKTETDTIIVIQCKEVKND